MIRNNLILITASAFLTISCAPKENADSQILNSYGVQKAFSDIGDWFNEGKGSEGSRVDWVYKNFPEVKTGEKVVVAVIDSGVDYEHEDLKGKIWINKAEIPNNGIDDDANGYVDDIYGWNYLTNKDGSTLGRTTLEVTRELSRLETKEQNEDLSASEKEYKAELEKSYNSEVSQRKRGIKKLEAEKSYYLAMLKSLDLDAENADISAISNLESQSKKDQLLSYLAKYRRAQAKNIAEVFNYVDARMANYNEDLTTYFRKHWDQRLESYDDFSLFSLEKPAYGNNDVMDLNGHGTHVAGIIAANRSNNLGINCVSNSVKNIGISFIAIWNSA